MFWWALLGVWLIGFVGALVLMEKEDREFWMRNGYAGKSLEDALATYRWAKIGLSLGSWLTAIGILRIAADNKRIARKVNEAAKEMNEAIRRLQEALEREKANH